jgi:hypothetical protein
MFPPSIRPIPVVVGGAVVGGGVVVGCGSPISLLFVALGVLDAVKARVGEIDSLDAEFFENGGALKSVRVGEMRGDARDLSGEVAC